MRTSRLGRAMVLGFALACTVAALAAAGWLVFGPERDCADLDPETCLALVKADNDFAAGLQPITLGLALAGPVLFFLWRDASRRAREAGQP